VRSKFFFEVTAPKDAKKPMEILQGIQFSQHDKDSVFR